MYVGDNRSLNGIDGNKVKGVKRMVVDKNGFLLAVMVTFLCAYKAAYLLAKVSGELSTTSKSYWQCRILEK